MELPIQDATAADLPKMIQLQQRSSIAGYPEPIRSLKISKPFLISNEIDRCWAAGDLFVVARHQEGLAGFAVSSVRGKRQTELIGLFVDPSLWRQSVGTGLIKQMERRLVAMGVEQLTVLANPLAESFYSATGFAEVDVVAMPDQEVVSRYRKTICPPRVPSP